MHESRNAPSFVDAPTKGGAIRHNHTCRHFILKSEKKLMPRSAKYKLYKPPNRGYIPSITLTDLAAGMDRSTAAR